MMKKITLFLISIFLLTQCTSTGVRDNKSHPQVWRMQQAIKRYQQLEHLPWQPISSPGPLKPGEQSPSIPLIKERLISLGDWPANCLENKSRLYDACLKKAMRQFQSRHGLKEDGVAGQDTLNALNVSPKMRLKSLKENLKEWATLPGVDSPPYLLVNVPGYSLNAIQHGKNELSMRVVVGKPNWPTPDMTSELKTVVINPGWNVPVNITEREIIHKIIENPNYLEEHNLKIIESWQPNAPEINPLTVDWEKYAGPKDLPYRLTQTPGKDSALGKLKFIFPNKHHIYLHDTPLKSFFSRSKRDLSHGCIRLQEPMALLAYLSQFSPNLSKEKIAPYMNSNKTKYLALQKNMPLYIRYMTSWVNDKGEVQFRPDIYNKYS